MRTTTGIAAGLLMLLLAVPAIAATDSAIMQVSVRVVPNCRISVTDLAFGAYDPLVEHAARNLDGTAQVRVVCTKNERATILMEEQQASPIRRLRSGSYEISYGIFSDPARTQTWGTGGNSVHLTFENSDPRELTVFGRIPPGQVVPAGTYLDSVIATVDF